MSTWAPFAEADEPAEQASEEAEPEAPPGAVEDLAVGKLRLWLRGMFGGDPQRRG